MSEFTSEPANSEPATGQSASCDTVPLRVALIIPTLVRGGAEKQLCLLAKGLLQQGCQPHVVVLTHDGPLHAELTAAGVPVTIIGKRFQIDPLSYRRLKQFLRRWNGDVVHTWLFAANSYGRMAAKAVGIPVVIGSERCVDRWKTPAHFLIDRYLAKRTDGLTTNSAGVVEFYNSHGIASENFTLIANGIAPRQTPEISRDVALARLKVPADKRLILAVGRLWPQKRYRDLIWAAELLATTRHDTVLVIIGDGPQQAELLRFRDAVSIPEHVRFAGSRDDVLQLLPHADLFWNGSEYEGQSNAMIEAMQASVCVVAADIPGNRDLIDHDVTGMLFPVGDRAALARLTNQLLNQNDGRDRLATAARHKIATSFSVEQMVTSHIALYRQRIASKREGRVNR